MIAFIKKNLIKLIVLILLVFILTANLENLGEQKNQLIKFVTVQNLTYDAQLIPTLLPIHQFLTFNKTEIIDRINCKVNSDTTACNSIEQRRCDHIDNTTEAFDECMANLSILRG